MVLAARSTSSATATRSAHDHQNHHKPSFPQPTYTFSSSARAAGLTTYRLGRLVRIVRLVQSMR